MEIEIVGRHVSVTESMRDYARKRMEKIVVEFPRLDRLRVIMDMQKFINRVEVTAHASRDIMVEAHAEHEDMYAAVDAVADKAHAQLRRSVDRRNERKSPGEASAAEVAPDDGNG